MDAHAEDPLAPEDDPQITAAAQLQPPSAMKEDECKDNKANSGQAMKEDEGKEESRGEEIKEGKEIFVVVTVTELGGTSHFITASMSMTGLNLRNIVAEATSILFFNVVLLYDQVILTDDEMPLVSKPDLRHLQMLKTRQGEDLATTNETLQSFQAVLNFALHPELQSQIEAACEKVQAFVKPAALGAAQAQRLVHHLQLNNTTPEATHEARDFVVHHVQLNLIKKANRQVRDLVVFRCRAECGDPNDREAFLMKAHEAYERDLDKELRAQFLLAFHKEVPKQIGVPSANQRLSGWMRS